MRADAVHVCGVKPLSKTTRQSSDVFIQPLGRQELSERTIRFLQIYPLDDLADPVPKIDALKPSRLEKKLGFRRNAGVEFGRADQFKQSRVPAVNELRAKFDLPFPVS